MMGVHVGKEFQDQMGWFTKAQWKNRKARSIWVFCDLKKFGIM